MTWCCWAGYFCEQCRLRMGLARVILAEAARNRLQKWSWPGNVRELEHAIHRAVVLARATQAGDEVVLEPQHFQFAVAAPMLPTETDGGGSGARDGKTSICARRYWSHRPLFAPDYYPAANSWLRCLGAAAL